MKCAYKKQACGAEQHVQSCHDYHSFSSTNPVLEDLRPSVEFVNAELTVVAVVLALMFLAVAFSIYALRHPRYIFKRVAGALHLLTSITLIVLFGLVRSDEHLAHHKTHLEILERSQHFYGVSLMLGVTVLIIFMSAGFAFLCLSKKRRDLLYDTDMNLK